MALGKRARRWRKRTWRGAIVKVARGNTNFGNFFASTGEKNILFGFGNDTHNRSRFYSLLCNHKKKKGNNLLKSF